MFVPPLRTSVRKFVPSRALAWLGVVQAYAVGLVLHLQHRQAHEAHAINPTLHWLRDSTLAVPLSLAALAVGTALTRALVRRSGLAAASPLAGGVWAIISALAYAVLSVPGNAAHGALFGAEHEQLPFVVHAARDGAVVMLAAALVLALFARPVRGATSCPLLTDAVRRTPAPALLRLRPATVSGLGAMAAIAAAVAIAGPTAVSTAIVGDGVCKNATRTIVYNVSAFQIDLPLNGWGDHLPDGLMYALDNDDARAGKASMLADPNTTQPLVVRANEGDCVKIKLRNDVGGRRVGIHADAILRQDPKRSDGAKVGNNPDTTLAYGEEREYTFYAEHPGQGVLEDVANLDNSVEGSSTIQRGLYGAVVVHPKSSTWRNDQTGKDLLSEQQADGSYQALETQVFADIRNPGGQNRSYAMVVMDEPEGVLDRFARTPRFPTTGLQDSSFGINYRSEPLRNRLGAVLEHRGIKNLQDPNPEGCTLAAWEEDHDDPTCKPKAIHLPNGLPDDPTGTVRPDDHFCDGAFREGLDADGKPIWKKSQDPGAICLGEESHLQSWPFGDEGKLLKRDKTTGEPILDADGHVQIASDNVIPKAYVGDPVTFHVVHPGAKETHPWHQHTQRWHGDPHHDNGQGVNDSPLLDVQSIGPGDSREFVIQGGAGGLQSTIGDSIFHCHLYPHFAQGFWGHLRIFDRIRDHEANPQRYPDGTPLATLKPLSDREAVWTTLTAGDPRKVEPATDAHPGFPLFVKGDVGQRAYRPPNTVIKDRFADLRRPGDAPRVGDPLERENLPALDKAAEVTTTTDPATGRSVTINTARNPGAAYIDSCSNANGQKAVNADNPRVYKPHAVDVPITYNSAGWKDPEGRIFVEESHEADVLAGRERPQPYTIRARVGECVRVETTNDLHIDDSWKGAPKGSVPIDIANNEDPKGQKRYMPDILTGEVSTHVHLVQFDELGTDGTSVGWNYSQSAMPGQTYGYRWYVDQPLRTIYFHDHQDPNSHQQKGLFAALNIEPAKATWHNPKTGAETDGTGTVADIHFPDANDPAKMQGFRELMVFHQDRAPMWKDNGTGAAIDAPPTVDDYGADQGGMALNYRNEPFPIRVKPGAPGAKGDPAYVYSSAVHGDPSTDVWKAYAKDPVVIRNMVGSHEEMHTFNLHGHRWLNEPDNPKSAQIDSQSLAIAEWFNYDLLGGTLQKRNLPQSQTVANLSAAGPMNGAPQIVEGGAGAPGDYLYGSQPLDDQWLGMWGIFRVPAAKVDDLQPLPNNPAPAQGNPWPAVVPASVKDPSSPPPAPAAGALSACPATAPVRRYDVVAAQDDIVYNARTGDHDPNGVFYAYADDVVVDPKGVAKSKPGINPGPLFLRANAGDCLKVKLSNGLPQGGIPDHDGDVPTPAVHPFPKSNRVSMHPSLVRYDPRVADGATVGFNYDQTVAPGRSITYTWYADDALSGSTANLVDFGDRRGHRHHGLFGGLLVEPKGSTWTNPATGARLDGTVQKGSGDIVGSKSGAQANIHYVENGIKRDFRDFALDFQDGLNLRTKDGAALENASPADDPEDDGDKAINYREERFSGRCEMVPAPPDPDAVEPAGMTMADPTCASRAMSSDPYGDPATPVMRANVGDDVKLRVLMGSDRARAHTFLLHGHEWPNQPGDPGSMPRSSQDGLMTGRAFTFNLTGGAGGRQEASGDYLYRDGNLHNQVNAGLWGIFRVFDGNALPGDPGAPAKDSPLMPVTK